MKNIVLIVIACVMFSCNNSEKEIEKTFFTPRVSKKKKNMKAGGPVKKCKRDGIAIRGKTKGRMV